MYSPGTGESGARARLASRTAVRCYIPVAMYHLLGDRRVDLPAYGCDLLPMFGAALN